MSRAGNDTFLHSTEFMFFFLIEHVPIIINTWQKHERFHMQIHQILVC